MNRLAANWMLLMASAKKSRLPSAYQEVKYLLSTGVQWIDTEITPTTNTRLEIDFKFTETPTTTQYIFNGAIDSGMFACRYRGTPDFQVQFRGTENVWSNTGITDINKHKYIVDASIGKWFIDDLEGQFTYSGSSAANILLLAYRSRSSYDFFAIGRIYGCSIKNNNELVRHLIPCYRKSDNKPGMYDIVNDVFYVNAGTGQDFILPGEEQ